MNLQEFFSSIEQIVQNYFAHDTTGHDVQHIRRVAKMARYIAQNEEVDAVYCELIAWLHDIGDYKLNQGVDKSREHLHAVLQTIPQLDYDLDQIVRDVQNVGFKGGFGEQNVSKEVQIVRDADRLDAIGAIGIARAFAYGGSKNRALYVPNDQAPSIHSAADYMQRNTSTIQHFYDKLLLLKDGMYTETAREIAIERHKILEDFLQEFYREWDFV